MSFSVKKSVIQQEKKSHELFGDDILHQLPSIDENELNIRKSQADTLLTGKIFQAARLSRKRLLHMLEHPRRMDYLLGAILKVFVSASRQIITTNNTFSAEPIASASPESVNKHVMCQIVTLNACDQYKVCEIIGCQHDANVTGIDNFIGSSKYVIHCVIMDDPYTNKLSASSTPIMVTLNDICDTPFNDIEIGKLKDFVIKTSSVETWYNKVKHIIKRLKEFTFTDDDVQTILKNKTSETSPSEGYNKRELIREIQACSNELDILSVSLRKIGTLPKREQDHLRNKFDATTKRKKELQSLLSDRRKTVESQMNDKISIDPSPFKSNKVYTFGIGGSIANRKSGMTTPMILSAAISSINNNSHTLDTEKSSNFSADNCKTTLNYNINDSKELINSFIYTLNNLSVNENIEDSNFILPNGYIKFDEYKKTLC